MLLSGDGQTSFIETDGATLHVAHRTGAPTVGLLHGLAGTADEWSDVTDHLPHDVGIIAPDLRAHGRSRVTTVEGLTAEAFTSDIATIIETLSDEPVVLVGQSMGGVIATRVAAQHPDLVAHLVLIDAGIAALDEDLTDLTHWLQTSETGHDHDSMLAVIRAVGDDDRSDEWASITAPVSVILAQESLVDPHDVAAMRQLQPDTTWVSVLQTGHDVHLDRPTAVAARLAEVIG